jgi:hypothetical protein
MSFSTLSPDGEFALLTKKPFSITPQELALLSTGEYSLGQDILVPQVEEGRVYIARGYSSKTAGRLANLNIQNPANECIL